MLDRQPTLEGELLVLRPLHNNDWQGLFAVASDPLIWEQHPAHDRWQEPVFRAFFEDALANAGALAVIDKQDGAIIGSSRYQALEPDNGGSVEIGWTFLARSHWGGVYNHEMKRLMVAHAFGSVAQCRFAVGAANWRSRKALEKIGARLIDRADIRGMAGSEAPHVFYAIDREGFEGGPLAEG